MLAVVFAVILVVNPIDGSGSGSEGPFKAGGKAVVLPEGELLARAATLDHSTYWVGARPGVEDYELETAPNGGVYIRYRDGTAGAGAKGSNVLTVATYPVADAERALRRAAKAATDGQALTRHIGFVTLSGRRADSAYVVFDDQPELQIEIYSPRPGEAARLAASDLLEPLP